MPNAGDRAAAAQAFERAVAALAQRLHVRRVALRPVLVHADVVDVEDIDPRQPQPLKAVLERAHDAVVGIVVDRVERQRVMAAVGVLAGRVGAQQPPDLGRQHPFVARMVAHRVADRALGLADAVERRGVDIAHPGAPGRGDDVLGRLAGDIDPAAAQGRAAEPQLRDLQLGAADLPSREFRHLCSPVPAPRSYRSYGAPPRPMKCD